MTARRRWVVLASALTLVLPGVYSTPEAQAAWTPETRDWPTFRQGTEHAGSTPGSSAFTAGQGGHARLKWEKAITYPVLGPPVAADIDDDGTPEVVVQSSDVRVQIQQASFTFNHKVESLNGSTGVQEWQQDEGDSFVFALPPNLGEIDNDDKAEVVYFKGNPLTGLADERLIARSHTGAQQWTFRDNDWSSTQQTVGILSGVHAANVDSEGTHHEVVVGVDQADLAVLPDQQEAGCANPGGPALKIEATNIKYFLHALNGEGANASESWQFSQNPGLLVSTPVITDLNGDGKNDVVWGSGAPEGVLLGECEVKVAVGPSAVDNRVIAVNGANPPNTLWTKSLQDPPGIDRPPAASPLVAGTTSGGDKILVMLIPVPKTAPQSHGPDRNILIALNGKTGAELWRLDLKPATINPLGAADLNGDGQPEVIAQVGDRLATFDNRTGANFWAGQGTGDLRGIPYDRELAAAGVAVADLDADGTQEIVTILAGDPTGTPAAELLVVSGADGTEEWRRTITGDSATGGPIIADIDGDDDLLEIVVATGFLTLTEGTARTGKVFAYEPNAPDLTVDAVTVMGSGIVNEPQTVRATVRNAGTRDVSNVPTRLRIDGTPTGGDQPVSLAAGASSTVDFAWTPTSSGNHSLAVTGDPDGGVVELVENNNTRTVTFRVKQRPTAAFTFSPASPNETQTVQFTDQSTDEGTITSWAWSCSDGFTGTQQNPSHKFADGGSYTCTLTVTDNDGLQDSTTKPVTVTHVAPVAGFSFSETSPHVVAFSDTSTHPNGPDAPPTGWAYAWDFDNDGTTDSTQRNPSHDFGADPGSSTVKLRVTDNDGLSSEITRTLRWPLADYTFSPTSPNENQTVQFTDQSSDPDGSISSRQWTCSDGFASTQQNPSHEFTDGGNHTCTLKVTDNQTLTDSVTKSLVVAHLLPNANYTHSILNPGQVQFTDTSTHPNPADAPPTGWTYQWDFEDDGVFDSSQRHPFHDFGVQTGVFDVRLRVTDNDGKVAEIVKEIDVSLANEPPTANFTWQAPVTINFPEVFTDQSTDPDSPIVLIEADFDGDGTFDDSVSGANVGGSQLSHAYTTPGDYAMKWRVTDSRGARDEIVKTVHVCKPPFELVIGPGLRIHFEFCPEPITN